MGFSGSHQLSCIVNQAHCDFLGQSGPQPFAGRYWLVPSPVPAAMRASLAWGPDQRGQMETTASRAPSPTHLGGLPTTLPQFPHFYAGGSVVGPELYRSDPGEQMPSASPPQLPQPPLPGCRDPAPRPAALVSQGHRRHS